MIITQIKKIGKGERYSIFIDGNFSCVLETEIIVKNQIKEGQEIDAEKWQDVRLQNGDLSCFSRSLSYLEKTFRTEKQLKDYLREKGFLEESIEKAISKLKEYGYIDDLVYAENYVKTYISKKGSKKIKFELLTKGVDREIVDEALNKIVDEDEERKRCFIFLKKYLKDKILDKKTKAKAYAHLISKGYSSEVVLSAIGRLEDESWD